MDKIKNKIITRNLLEINTIFHKYMNYIEQAKYNFTTVI
jgi:hypothetical protein